MSILEVATEFGCSTETVRRWIRKEWGVTLDQVEVHGGQYYVAKEAVQVWRNALDGKKPMKGKVIPVGGKAIHVGGLRKTTDKEDAAWLDSQSN